MTFRIIIIAPNNQFPSLAGLGRLPLASGGRSLASWVPASPMPGVVPVMAGQPSPTSALNRLARLHKGDEP
jgi:hypothetical protein